MILTKRQLLFPILILNRFLKSCVTSRCAMRTTLLNKKISLQDFFYVLGGLFLFVKLQNLRIPLLKNRLRFTWQKKNPEKIFFTSKQNGLPVKKYFLWIIFLQKNI